MKVIVAGLYKTGTTTMHVALKQLPGYDVVHHYMETYIHAGKDWVKICEDGGTIEDFRRIYEGVDAVTDNPPAYFWEQLMEAFPEAKIILTVRDSEDMWFQSVLRQQSMFNKPIFTLLQIFSPSFRRFYFYCETMALAVFGTLKNSPFKQGKSNELLCRMTYRRHNSYVMQLVVVEQKEQLDHFHCLWGRSLQAEPEVPLCLQAEPDQGGYRCTFTMAHGKKGFRDIETAPKDKLLVFNVKEGWDPLCKFLGVPVPTVPFPHKNVRGNLTSELLAANKLMIRMQREMYFNMFLASGLLLFAGYKLVKSSFFSRIFGRV